MTEKTNILISSVGRRGYLVKAFKEALNNVGELIVANSNNFATAKKYADYSYILPNSYEERYFQEIIKICVKHDIKFIISLHDVEIYYLSKLRDGFSEYGIKLLIPNDKTINLSFDKYEMYKWGKSNKISIPTTYINISKFLEAPIFPVLLKNRFGYGSDKIQIVDNESELRFFYTFLNKQLSKEKALSSLNVESYVIIQELLIGKEYGLDILNDLNGKYINSYVLEKFSMRAGETEIAKIIDNNDLLELGKQISQLTKHLGLIDIDIIEVANNFKIIDINPRFGGHYPFFHHAGVHLPKAVISLLHKREIEKEDLTIKDFGTKYKELIIK